MVRGARRATLAAVVIAASVLGFFATTADATAAHGPIVSWVWPTSGTTNGGTRVTVLGGNFQHVAAVRFGSVNVTGKQFTVLSSKRLVVIAPRHAAGTVDLRVVTNGGTSAIRSADRFRYVAPPTITSMAPTGGLPGGGTRVTIKGANFVGSVSVGFGTSAGRSIRVVSAGELQVTAPAHAAGAVDVRVTTPYGRSTVVVADRFTYRDAPQGVDALAVQDLTATSATLRWTPSPSPGLAGVVIRRALGSTAPASSSSGTGVATLSATATAFIDTGLARNTTYAYAVFAYTSAGPLYSAPTSIVVTTPGNSRPDGPTAFGTAPQPISGNVCAPTPYPWLGSLTGGNLGLGAHISDPDGLQQSIRAHFRLWDLGGTGTDAPTYLVGADDPAGESGPINTGGGYVTKQLDGALLTDGHLYGADAVVDDGIVRGAANEPCHFWYDSSGPTGLQITSPNSSIHVGDSVHFDFAASDVVPSGGQYSGIDHFEYALNSNAFGTHIPADVTGADATASLTLRLGTWGEMYLSVIAVDKAGNRSLTSTYNFYVIG